MYINDLVYFPIANNNIGSGILINPKETYIDAEIIEYHAEEKEVLVRAIVNNELSYLFWIKKDKLIFMCQPCIFPCSKYKSNIFIIRYLQEPKFLGMTNLLEIHYLTTIQ